MDYTKALERFDFTKNESIVYVALLEMGLTGVGPIVKKTGLHRQLIYQALETLSQKGYVLNVSKNDRKHFQAVSPDAIMKHIEAKIDAAQEILPELLKLRSRAQDAIEVRTLYGRAGLIENLKDLLASAARHNQLMRIIGGAKDGDIYALLGDWYPDYVELARKQHVAKHLIVPANQAETFKRKFAQEHNTELRLLSSGLSAPTYTRITPDMVSTEIYTPNQDVTIIQIRSRAIALAYIEHFNLLWAQAEEYQAEVHEK